MPETQGLLKFEAFREAVGYSESRVRQALFTLMLHPVPGNANPRKTFYRSEWVERVRACIIERVSESDGATSER